jgi:hypothetical protein
MAPKFGPDKKNKSANIERNISIVCNETNRLTSKTNDSIILNAEKLIKIDFNLFDFF